MSYPVFSSSPIEIPADRLGATIRAFLTDPDGNFGLDAGELPRDDTTLVADVRAADLLYTELSGDSPADLLEAIVTQDLDTREASFGRTPSGGLVLHSFDTRSSIDDIAPVILRLAAGAAAGTVVEIEQDGSGDEPADSGMLTITFAGPDRTPVAIWRPVYARANAAFVWPTGEVME